MRLRFALNAFDRIEAFDKLNNLVNDLDAVVEISVGELHGLII